MSSVAFMFVFLVVLIYVLWLVAGMPLYWVVGVKLVVLSVMLPFAILYIRRNRPRPFDPDAVPDALLPMAEPAAEGRDY
jgi:hypothetical protein